MAVILNETSIRNGRRFAWHRISLLAILLAVACSKREPAPEVPQPSAAVPSTATVLGASPTAPPLQPQRAAEAELSKSEVGFSPKSCLREHFPFALGIPEGAVPREVKFFCAAPWNEAALKHVEATLLEGGFSPTDALVRNRKVPDAKKSLLRESLALALKGTDMGPTGMRSAWYTFQFLPLLHALHAHTSDEAAVEGAFEPDDVKHLRAAADRLKWDTPVLRKIQRQGGAKLSDDADLTTVSAVILAI